MKMIGAVESLIGAIFKIDCLKWLIFWICQKCLGSWCDCIFYSTDSNKLIIMPMDSLGDALIFISIMSVRNMP